MTKQKQIDKFKKLLKSDLSDDVKADIKKKIANLEGKEIVYKEKYYE